MRSHTLYNYLRMIYNPKLKPSRCSQSIQGKLTKSNVDPPPPPTRKSCWIDMGAEGI